MDRSGHNRDEDIIIDLLGELKNAGPEYPPRLHAARRAAVLASLAALPMLGGSLAGMSLLARFIKIFKMMGVVEKIIVVTEIVAVAGLASYGAATAYIYRDTLRRLILPVSAVGTPFPSLSVPLSTNTGVAAGATGSLTPTPTGTLTLTVPPLITQFPGQPGTTVQPPVGTPEPPAPKATKTPPGLHLGQTKTPKPPSTPSTP